MSKLGNDAVFTKKSDSKQTITVKNRNDDTRTVVYGSNLRAFTTYLKAAMPTSKQTTLLAMKYGKKLVWQLHSQNQVLKHLMSRNAAKKEKNISVILIIRSIKY